MEWLTGLVAGALPFAFVLACPIAMFLMMRVGMPRMSHGAGDLAKLTPEQRLAHLEMQQTALAQQIASTRSEFERTSAVPARRAS